MTTTIVTILRILALAYNLFVIFFTVMWYLEAKQSKSRLKTMFTMIAFSILNIVFACVPNMGNF